MLPKKTYIKIIILSLPLFNLACSTMGEALSPVDTVSGYRKKEGTSNTYTRTRRSSNRNYTDEFNRRYRDQSGFDRNYYNDAGSLEPAALLLSALSETQSNSYANSYNGSSSKGVAIGVSSSFLGEDGVAQIGLEVEKLMIGDWFAGRIGGSIFNSDLLYAGGTLGVRASVPGWKLSPYIGLEGYLGDHKSCQVEYADYGERVETCEKTFLGTLYSELGLKWKIASNAKVYLFTRGYSKVDQTVRRDLTMFYGASLFFGNL